MDANPLYVGLWIRIKAFLLDYIILAVYLVALVAAGFLLNQQRPDVTQALFGRPLRGQLSGFLVVTLPVTLYFAFSESSRRQATWGKNRLGLQVSLTNGRPLTFGRALGRTLLKFTPWEVAHTCIWQVTSAGGEPSPLVTAGFVLVWLLVIANGIAIWLHPKHQALYDQVAQTVVARR